MRVDLVYCLHTTIFPWSFAWYFMMKMSIFGFDAFVVNLGFMIFNLWAHFQEEFFRAQNIYCIKIRELKRVQLL